MYWLRVITLLVDVCILDYENVCTCMMKSFSTIAYPLCLLYVLCVVFSFCDDHQFIDVILVVNRVMDIPLHSLSELNSVVQVSLGYSSCISCPLGIHFEYY